MEKRVIYFDYLRVFSIFAVIVLHMAAKNWYYTDVRSFDWQVFNFFDSITRFAVPIFVMISGAIFLNRDIPIKKIYSKYVLRLVIAFVVWSILYFLILGSNSKLTLITGYYHLWFVFMISGLYICIPIFKVIIKNEKVLKYFFSLSFVFAFLFPTMTTLINDFGSQRMINIVTLINKDLSNMNVSLVMAYSGYFMLGYYLNKIKISKKQRTIIYILSIIGMILTVVLDSVVAIKTNKMCSNYYTPFSINVLFASIGVFTFFKYRKYKHKKLNSLFIKLSNYSFGAYLVHALVQEELTIIFGLNSLSFNAILSVISLSIIVFIISYLISFILNCIPIVKKYIV